MSSIETDKKIRAQALDPRNSFIVQAPAGSGKTELLIQRYLRLLACVEKAPEEIIAITFTRKASAEMRERIMSALALANEPAPELEHKKTTWQLANAVAIANKKHGWNLEKNPNRLRIMTIDALSAMLNAQIPLLSGFGASIDVMNEPDAFYRLAVERLLRHLQKSNTPQYEALNTLLLHFDNNAEQLATLLQDLLSKREQWLPHIIYHYRDRERLRDTLEKSLSHIVEETLQKAEHAFPETHLEIAIELLIFSSELENFDFSLAHWQALANLFLTKTGTWRKTVDKRSGFPPKAPEKEKMLSLLDIFSNDDALLNTLNEIKQCPPAHYNTKQWRIIDALLEVLPLLTAELTLLFQEEGEIDFTEQTLGALRALGTEEQPTELAMHLDYQIKHILIDEFQDTSVIQFHLIEKLIREWQPEDGRTLFIVGDPMQSIYRFRQAEVGLFLRLQQQPIQQIQLTPLTLKCNFRSEKNIVDWVNQTFTAVFPKTADISEGAVPYETSTAVHANSLDQNIFFYNHANANASDQAKTLVKRIEQLKKNHPQDTMAILVRSRSHLPEIIHSLRENQLAFHAVDIEPLIHYPEIQDLLSLTKGLLHLNDHIAWLSILRSPLCGLTLTDLHRLTLNDDSLPIWWTLNKMEHQKKLSPDGQIRLNKIIAVFSKSFTEQAQLNLSDWIENTWLNLNGPSVLKNEKALQRCETFFELLRQAQTHFVLFDFVKQIEKRFAKNTNEDNALIQILTIHKSKGLEFDHVFLPHLEKKFQSESARLLQWLERISMHQTNDLVLAPIKSKEKEEDQIYSYLSDMEKNKLTLERARLLYVACTRAKKTLHLSAITKEGESNHSFLALLLKTIRAEFEKNTLLYEDTKTDLSQPALTYLTRLTDLNANTENQHLAYAQPYHENNTIQKVEKENLEARVTGTFIHEVLEKWANNPQPSALYDKKQIRNRLVELGLPLSSLEAQTNLILLAIENIQRSEKAQWLLQQDNEAQTEYPLSTMINGELKTYIIDRTFVDQDNVRWIVDYKTSQPKEGNTPDFLLSEKQKYLTQLEEYAKLFSQFEARRIKLGLYFPLCDNWIAWEFKEIECNV